MYVLILCFSFYMYIVLINVEINDVYVLICYDM